MICRNYSLINAILVSKWDYFVFQNSILLGRINIMFKVPILRKLAWKIWSCLVEESDIFVILKKASMWSFSTLFFLHCFKTLNNYINKIWGALAVGTNFYSLLCTYIKKGSNWFISGKEILKGNNCVRVGSQGKRTIS